MIYVQSRWRLCAIGAFTTLLLSGWLLLNTAGREAHAAQFGLFGRGCSAPGRCGGQDSSCSEWAPGSDVGGSWFWMRSPEQEKAVTSGHFNRYCIRCHGVDGRGVWDIPGIPDFTNPRWQACRTDAQLVRIIIEGRGAVMPPFRGTLTLEEAWAMARFLRSFDPAAAVSRPDLSAPDKGKGPQMELPPAKK
jgi:hypothetical protein